MADRYWFDQQQPTYGYAFYGQLANARPPPAGFFQYGNPHQPDEGPFQQSAPGQPFYGQQAFDAATYGYIPYSAAAAAYGHPAGFTGHDCYGTAYMAAPHDMQQHQHQQQQDPFAVSKLLWLLASIKILMSRMSQLCL